MATLKRQRADGTWEYIQLTGEDVLALRNEFNEHKADYEQVAIKGKGERIERSNGMVGIPVNNDRTGVLTVTFENAFTEVPDVLVTSRSNNWIVACSGLTTTGFSLNCRKYDDSIETNTVYVHWFAVGR